MRGRLIIAAACCAGVVAASAPIAQATSPGATLSMGAPAAPNTAAAPAAPQTAGATAATLTAAPARPTVGQPVRLVVAAPPGARGFAWALGAGALGRHTGVRAQTETGVRAQTETDFSTPGVHAVAVRFTVAGQTRLAALTLSVGPRATPRARAPHARSHHAATTGLAGRVTAHVAGDPGVTVADFHFSPAATTIHVGDTITWSNAGPSSHTATAHGGSFDTGVLKKGQSASHTFTQAGTFTYFCQIHPFMHGTIVVLAATTTKSAATTPTATTPAATTPTATTAATTPTATTAAAAPTGPTLPSTGFNVLTALGAGVLLVGLGAGLRRGPLRWGRPPGESGRPR
jgi:plastocyanin